MIEFFLYIQNSWLESADKTVTKSKVLSILLDIDTEHAEVICAYYMYIVIILT